MYKLRRCVSTLDFLRFTQRGDTSTQLVNCAAETHASQAANFNSGQSVMNGKLNQWYTVLPCPAASIIIVILISRWRIHHLRWRTRKEWRVRYCSGQYSTARIHIVYARWLVIALWTIWVASSALEIWIGWWWWGVLAVWVWRRHAEERRKKRFTASEQGSKSYPFPACLFVAWPHFTLGRHRTTRSQPKASWVRCKAVFTHERMITQCQWTYVY